MLAKLGTQFIADLPIIKHTHSIHMDQLFITDGYHIDQFIQLVIIRDLKVNCRTLVIEYRDTNRNISQVASKLGMTSAPEGGSRSAY